MGESNPATLEVKRIIAAGAAPSVRMFLYYTLKSKSLVCWFETCQIGLQPVMILYKAARSLAVWLPTLLLLFEARAQTITPSPDNPAPSAASWGFHRVGPSGSTTNVSLDADGLLTARQPAPGFPFLIETASDLNGPWTSNQVHTVLANIDGELSALVPLEPSAAPPSAFSRTNWLARARLSILIGDITCQIIVDTSPAHLWTAAWRNFQSGGPSHSDLRLYVFLAGRRGGESAALPDSLILTRLWAIHNGEVWDATAGARILQGGVPGFIPGSIQIYGGGGPEWELGTGVDIVLQLTDNGVNYLLRVNQVPIDATI